MQCAELSLQICRMLVYHLCPLLLGRKVNRFELRGRKSVTKSIQGVCVLERTLCVLQRIEGILSDHGIQPFAGEALCLKVFAECRINLGHRLAHIVDTRILRSRSLGTGTLCLRIARQYKSEIKKLVILQYLQMGDDLLFERTVYNSP